MYELLGVDEKKEIYDFLKKKLPACEINYPDLEDA